MSAKRILIIDDEAELRELLSITFSTNSFTVFTAADGEEGLKMAQSKKPDVILLDIKMPRLNGYELLARMRKDTKLNGIPKIVLTSLTEKSPKSDQDWAASLEVDDFVSKPVEPYELLERVERVLSARGVA